MIKSALTLLAAGGFTWAACHSPGPPVMAPDYRVAQFTHYGSRIGSEPLRVRKWDRNVLVHVELAGCQPGGGSVRFWVVGSGSPEAYPRQSYDFPGSTGSVQCAIPLRVPLPCRVVVCAEDNQGHRDTRSFAVDLLQ